MLSMLSMMKKPLPNFLEEGKEWVKYLFFPTLQEEERGNVFGSFMILMLVNE